MLPRFSFQHCIVFSAISAVQCNVIVIYTQRYCIGLYRPVPLLSYYMCYMVPMFQSIHPSIHPSIHHFYCAAVTSSFLVAGSFSVFVPLVAEAFLEQRLVQSGFVRHHPHRAIDPIGIVRHLHVGRFLGHCHSVRRRPRVEGIVDVVVPGKVVWHARQDVDVNVRDGLARGPPVLDRHVEGGRLRVGSLQEGLNGPDQVPEVRVFVRGQVRQVGDDPVGCHQHVSPNDRPEVDEAKGGRWWLASSKSSSSSARARSAKNTGLGNEEFSKPHAAFWVHVVVVVVVVVVGLWL